MKQIPVTESWHIGADGKPDSHHISVEPMINPDIDPCYRGEPDCGDCCTMSHCETHHKVEGTYPFDYDVPRPLRPMSRGVVSASSVLKRMFPRSPS